MKKLPTPPVPVLARAQGDTVAELVDWFVDYFNEGGVYFNYRRGTRITRAAYKGMHSLPLLVAGCQGESTAVGRSANADMVRHAAPIAFGRTTQVFDLTPRRFPFGRDRFAAYRIPFFFVENGIIKTYFVQPTKGIVFDKKMLGMIATIIKRYLLDAEFFGQRCDIELVDIGAPDGKVRMPRRYSLADLPLWSDRQLENRLTMLVEALDIVASGERVVRRPRAQPRPEPDMPLFD